MPTRQCMLFETPGRHNTADCIRIAQDYCREFSIRHLVVASTTGTTAAAVHEAFKDSGINVVVVTHSVGFKEPNQDEFAADIRRRILTDGGKICTGTILTHALEKSLMDKFSGSYPGAIIAGSLRRFGEGSKVAIEIVMEACDAGLIPEDAEVLSMAGTGHGADTILLVKSKASKRFLDLEVLEIPARPRGR